MLNKYRLSIYKILPIVCVLAMASCKTWDESDQQAWRQACMENAGKWAADEQNAKTYCECVLDKMMKKYPDVNQALEHVNDLATDTSFYNCRKEIKLK